MQLPEGTSRLVPHRFGPGPVQLRTFDESEAEPGERTGLGEFDLRHANAGLAAGKECPLLTLKIALAHLGLDHEAFGTHPYLDDGPFFEGRQDSDKLDRAAQMAPR